MNHAGDGNRGPSEDEMQAIAQALEAKERELAEVGDDLAATRQTLQDYRAALDASAHVAITDARGVIQHANDRFCQISGYTRAELIGKTHRVVNSAYHPPEFFEAMWRTILAGETWRGTIRNRTKAGRHYWVDTTITPLLGPDGAPERFMAIRHDVTEKVESMEHLAASEARFRTIFEHAGIGVAMVTLDDRIIAANPTFLEMLRFPTEELADHPFTDFTRPEDARADQPLFQELVQGDADVYEVTKRYVRRDGTSFWGETTVSVVRAESGEPVQIIGMVRDVTQVRLAEERLREQAALARLGQMAAVVAHEVRNPLAGILGAVKVIGTQLAPDAPAREVIDTIAKRIASLDELVEDLLLFARPHEPRTRPVAVSSLLVRVREVVSASPTYRDAQLDLPEEDAKIEVDPDLIERVLLNLVLNAIQAMHGGGTVRVELHRAGDQLCVDVLDRGPGIAPELEAKVFEPFFTTKSRGAGLGLATARQLVDAHGGSLHASNRAGGGTRMRVRLPLAACDG